MIRPEFSEFTFGYAFTENLTNGWLPAAIRAVPIFPSLTAEGQRSGGYDVALPTRGLPVLIQFKIPQIVTRRSGRLPPQYVAPYYRMHIESGARSAQHASLLEHERNGHEVLYVAPCFDTLHDLGSHYAQYSVPAECVYFGPGRIGALDHRSHYVAYRRGRSDAWLFSDPKRIDAPEGAIEFRARLIESVRNAPVIGDRNRYFSALASDLSASVRAAVDQVPQADLPVLDRGELPFVHEGMRPVLPADLLGLVNAADRIEDPLQRYAAIASFMLDCRVVLVGGD